MGSAFNTGANIGPSLTLAAVLTVLSGTPRPSTSKCSLEPGFPRSVGLGPASFSPRRSPHQSPVRRLPLPLNPLLLIIQMQAPRPDLLKNPRPFPLGKAIIYRLPGTKDGSGHRTPRTPGPQHVQHAIK